MAGGRVVGLGLFTLCAVGCVTQQAAITPEESLARLGQGGSGPVETDRTYVDPELGFSIARPSGDWKLSATTEPTEEGLSIPVVMRDAVSGAQVVLQVAPAVATPTQFAERLTSGLRAHPGFSSSDPEPLSIREGAVGFQFALGDKVEGRVAVMEGKGGQMFMMLATWPADAPEGVEASVEEIFGSLTPLPMSASSSGRGGSGPGDGTEHHRL